MEANKRFKLVKTRHGWLRAAATAAVVGGVFAMGGISASADTTPANNATPIDNTQLVQQTSTNNNQVNDNNNETNSAQNNNNAQINAMNTQVASDQKAVNDAQNAVNNADVQQNMYLPSGMTQQALQNNPDSNQWSTWDNQGINDSRNNYVTDKKAAAETVTDYAHLTSDQTEQIQQYTGNLINDIRTQAGAPLVKIDGDGVTQFANQIRAGYENDQWYGTKGHDVNVILSAASNNGLDNSGQYYENYGSGFLAKYGNQTMDGIQKSIYEMVKQMMFNDAPEGQGHTISLMGGNADATCATVEMSTFIDNMNQIHIIAIPSVTILDSTKFNANGKYPTPVVDMATLNQTLTNAQSKLANDQSALKDLVANNQINEYSQTINTSQQKANVVTLQAQPSTGNVTFHFHDANGNEIKTNDGHASFTWTGDNGQQWDYSNWIPEINGYTYSHADQYVNNALNGHALVGSYAGNANEDVYLTYDQAQQSKGTVTFHFHDANGNEIKTNDGHASFAWTGDEGQQWDYNNWIPEINGYTYSHADQYVNNALNGHALVGSYAGNANEDVYLTYDQNQAAGEVRFHFHDENGNEIKTNDGQSGFTWTGATGTNWDYTNWVPEINGYVYDHADQYNQANVNHSLSGTFSAEGPTDVYLTFSKPTVNIYYHDQNGNEISAPTKIEGNVGQSWNYENLVPTIKGYDYSHADQYVDETDGAKTTQVAFDNDLNGTFKNAEDVNLYLTYFQRA
ncbi:SEC10/PgrA surface exclusion domain-containing protein [Fructilactobacillus sp. Tb1]|uniref:SEC10/PgrA surface exclusion domain-containing protein n=1 Tax=Fructilactobacillus sp. Tb1 TaxID=3422304 RepID=UPI003D280DC6